MWKRSWRYASHWAKSGLPSWLQGFLILTVLFSLAAFGKALDIFEENDSPCSRETTSSQHMLTRRREITKEYSHTPSESYLPQYHRQVLPPDRSCRIIYWQVSWCGAAEAHLSFNTWWNFDLSRIHLPTRSTSSSSSPSRHPSRPISPSNPHKTHRTLQVDVTLWGK